jgi:hypothetical protein
VALSYLQEILKKISLLEAQFSNHFMGLGPLKWLGEEAERRAKNIKSVTGLKKSDKLINAYKIMHKHEGLSILQTFLININGKANNAYPDQATQQ